MLESPGTRFIPGAWLTVRFNYPANTFHPAYCAVLAASLFLGLELKAGPVVFRPFDALWIVAMLGLMFRATRFGSLPRLAPSLSLLFFSCFLIYSGLNAMFQTSLPVGIKEFVQGLQFILLFYYFSAFLSDEHSRQHFLGTFYALIAIIAVANTLFHLSQGIYSGYKELDEPKLVYGMLGLFAFVTYLFEPRPRRFAGLVLIAAIVLLLLSGERKAWAAFSVATAAVLFFGSLELARSSKSVRVLILAAFSMVAIPLCLAMASHIEYFNKQLMSLQDVFSYFQSGETYSFDMAETLSTRMRIYLFEKSVEIYHANPVFGIGPEGFQPYIKAVSYHLPSGFVKTAHNEYLRIAAETGSVGLALYLLCCLSILRDAIWFVQRRTRLAPPARLQVWSLLGLVVYGAVLNAFLAGGAVNLIFLLVPAALLVSARTSWSFSPHPPTNELAFDHSMPRTPTR